MSLTPQEIAKITELSIRLHELQEVINKNKEREIGDGYWGRSQVEEINYNVASAEYTRVDTELRKFRYPEEQGRPRTFLTAREKVALKIYALTPQRGIEHCFEDANNFFKVSGEPL